MSQAEDDHETSIRGQVLWPVWDVMAESIRHTGRHVRKGASIGFLREQVTAVGN